METTARIPTNTLERAGSPKVELREQWNEGTPDGGRRTIDRTHENPKLAHEAPHRRGKLATPGEPWSRGKKLSVAGCVDCDGMKLGRQDAASRRAARHSATAADSADSLVGPPSPWMLSRVAGAALRGALEEKPFDQWIRCGRDSRLDQISKSEGALGCVAVPTPSGIRHLRCRAGADTNSQQSPGGMPACFRRCPRGRHRWPTHCAASTSPAPMLPSPPVPASNGTQQRLLLDELTLRPASIPCRSPCGSPALDGLGITDSIREDHTAPGQGPQQGRRVVGVNRQH
ncbi:hypothetical protein BKA56DRAFT_689184 [Ilyonectria sp. MPI-CAGE-AT-0026]|nr:hypothetical protein BKA56DRAFT_689184 [Ilyonectria sp. MPI-CAGE-AT-0026]